MYGRKRESGYEKSLKTTYKTRCGDNI